MRMKTLKLTIGGLAVVALSALPRAQTAAPASVRDGIYSDEQARRGEQIYKNECALCHGPALEGAEQALPLVGAEFVANWSGLTADDLVERIRVTMPEREPGKLGRQQTADLLAFILRRNGYPSGANELSREQAVLKGIRIEPPR